MIRNLSFARYNNGPLLNLLPAGEKVYFFILCFTEKEKIIVNHTITFSFYGMKNVLLIIEQYVADKKN